MADTDSPVTLAPSMQSPPGTAPGPGPAAGDDRDMQALAAERKEMATRIAALKNDKLRREVEKMEAEAAAEDAARARALHLAEEAGPDGAGAALAGAPGNFSAGPGLQTVPQARPRTRHWLGLASFVVMVIVPVLVSAWYLWARAADRYVSYAGFSVRTEEISSALELLGGVAQLSGSSSSDTDILYNFIQSPDLVARIEDQLGLRDIWSRPGTGWFDSEADPIFAYRPGGGMFGAGAAETDSIENLTEYWGRMVGVYSDSGTGLINLEVQAFTPAEAQAIAQVIYDESTAMINRLSAIAREDATSYARDELEKSVERLKTARAALTGFRNRTQIVDPTASIQGQMGLLSSLQAQLAQTLIDLDILRQTSREGDPRSVQAERRVEVIEERIAAERRKLGLGLEGAGGESAFADLLGEYERLAVDLEFAEQSYTAALTTFDSAVAEAQRQTRYLAAHITPTLPQSPVRPDRPALLALVAIFAFLIWVTSVLVIYALRDRR